MTVHYAMPLSRLAPLLSRREVLLNAVGDNLASDGSGSSPDTSGRVSAANLLFAVPLLITSLLVLSISRRFFRVKTGFGLACGVALFTWSLVVAKQGDSYVGGATTSSTNDLIVWGITAAAFSFATILGTTLLWQLGLAFLALDAGFALALSFLLMADEGGIRSIAARWVFLAFMALLALAALAFSPTRWRDWVELIETSFVGSFLFALSVDLLVNGPEGLSLGLRKILDMNGYHAPLLEYSAKTSSRIIIPLCCWLLTPIAAYAQRRIFPEAQPQPTSSIFSAFDIKEDTTESNPSTPSDETPTPATSKDPEKQAEDTTPLTAAGAGDDVPSRRKSKPSFWFSKVKNHESGDVDGVGDTLPLASLSSQQLSAMKREETPASIPPPGNGRAVRISNPGPMPSFSQLILSEAEALNREQQTAGSATLSQPPTSPALSYSTSPRLLASHPEEVLQLPSGAAAQPRRTSWDDAGSPVERDQSADIQQQKRKQMGAGKQQGAHAPPSATTASSEESEEHSSQTEGSLEEDIHHTAPTTPTGSTTPSESSSSPLEKEISSRADQPVQTSFLPYQLSLEEAAAHHAQQRETLYEASTADQQKLLYLGSVIRSSREREQGVARDQEQDHGLRLVGVVCAPPDRQSIKARITSDGWKTLHDVHAARVSGTMAALREDEKDRDGRGCSSRTTWQFVIPPPAIEGKAAMEIAICATSPDGTETWDSNQGTNYRIPLL